MFSVASGGGRGDRLAELLPAELLPLFDDRFVGSCVLFEEYVHRLAIQVVRSAGIDSAAREPGTPGEIAARGGDGRYTVPAALPDLDPREVADAQERHDPSSLASYRMADLAAALYPSVLRGTASGEETLFAPDRIGAWFEYFSNDNLIYTISNRIGAFAAERALQGDGGPVLELGGGLGSGTAAFLERFMEAGRLSTVRSYRFTEIAPSFLRRGQRRLTGRFPGVPLLRAA